MEHASELQAFSNKGTTKFEDLEVWKHSLQLSMDLSQTFFNLKDYGFKNQITLTGLSVTSNNVGGWEYESLKESLQFFVPYKDSCGELRTQIHIEMKINSIATETGLRWIQETKEISVMLTGLSKTDVSYFPTET